MKRKKSLASAIIPRKVDSYFIFEELNADSIGKNFRAVELRKGAPQDHKLLTKVHPVLFKDAEEWKRANVLHERLRHANIPNLYIPEKVIKKDDRAFFVFPFLKGKTLVQVVKDAQQKESPIPFDLAFYIAIAIAAMLEAGSAIVVRNQNAFHGFLTPGHIIIDYDGNIFLKYFGLWPLFEESEAVFSEMTRKYGFCLSPEFIRREKIVPQSDFYYLGYIVYLMLTGDYFSYLPGEDFESTFTSISFVSDLPSTDIEFLTTLINFFRKTLNPIVSRRFDHIEEFKDYILKSFQSPDDDYADFQFRLSAYMKILYPETMEAEEKILAAELSQPLPEDREISEKPVEDEDEVMETIFLDERAQKETKHSKLLLVTLIIVILALAGGIYFLVDQLNKAKEEQQKTALLLEKQDREKRESERQLQEVHQKIKTLEEQKTFTNGEQKIKDEAISQLKKQEKKLRDDIKARTKAMTDTGPSKPEQPKKEKMKKEIVKTGIETETEVKPAPDLPKSPEPAITVTPPPTGKRIEPIVPLVSPGEVTVKPVKISGEEPEFPPEMIRTYVGRRATVNARLLINENGAVLQVELADERKIPADVRAVIKDTLKKWRYNPAKKDDIKVKVWWPIKMRIHFKQNI